MTTREHRFFGSGNASVEDGSGIRRKVWQITCGVCNATAVVHLSRGFLPPDVVVKKFRQQGWIVGAKPGGDTCGKCGETNCSVCSPKQQEPDSGLVRLLKQQLKMANDDRAQLQSQNNELRSKNKDLGFRKDLESSGYSKLVLDVHGLLLFERIEEALQKIETAFPNWPWEKRLPKEKGSAAPERRQQPKDDPGFDAWLNELESGRKKVVQNGADHG